MKETLKNVKGITLIVLVITIIILLILSGITIIALTGENGLFTRANEAKMKTEIQRNMENMTLSKYEDTINQTIEGTTRDNNLITFRQIVTVDWTLEGFSGYMSNISTGENEIDISKYNFLKKPYAIVKGTRALTAIIKDVTTTSLKIDWHTAWGSGVGSGFGKVEILLMEPN